MADDALIRALFDGPVAIAAGAPAVVDDELYPDERQYLQRAVPKRRAEFGTARVCARRALASLGVEPCSLVPHEDRSPRWPPGVVGTISHTQGYCAAVVARAHAMTAIGLDVELERPLDRGVVELVCTEAERRRLSAPGAASALVYFSAKEAFYKCQYPSTRTFLDFQDVELDVDVARGTFRPRLLKAIPGKPSWIDRLEGRFLLGAGMVLSGVEVRAPA